jgi:hypothetical protein
MATLVTQIEFRQDTFENLKNIVLASGEPAYITDTKQHVIGDGESTVEELLKNTDIDEAYEIRTSAEKVKLVENIVDQSVVLERAQGRTLVRNQYINGNGTCYISGNEIDIPIGAHSSISQSVNTLVNPIPSNHKVLCIANFTEGYNNTNSGEAAFGGYHRGGGTPNSWQGYIQIPYNTNLSGKTLYSMYTTTDTVTDIWMFLYVGTNITTAIKGYVNYIDLTQAYGEGNEPTTVEEVLNDLPDYIPYDEGTFVHSNNKLISIGKNLLKNIGLNTSTSYGITFTKNSDGSVKASGTATNFAVYYINTNLLLKKGTYVKSHPNLIIWDKKSSYLGTNFELKTDMAVYCYLQFNAGDTVNTVIYPQIEYGEIATDYEPYKENVVEGIGELKQYDYKDIQSGTDVFGSEEVDLGTLNWSYSPSNNIASAVIADMKQNTSYDERKKGIICTKYPISSNVSIDASMDDKSMLKNKGYIYIRDTSCTNVTEFKEAMSGVKLLYEKETSTIVENNNLPTGYSAYNKG